MPLWPTVPRLGNALSGTIEMGSSSCAIGCSGAAEGEQVAVAIEAPLSRKLDPRVPEIIEARE